MSNEKKTQQVGTLRTDDGGRERIQFGNTKNKDEKYNYTVELRVLDYKGNLITTKTNPRLTLWDPRENSPEWLKKNITVDLGDYVPKTATEQIEDGI